MKQKITLTLALLLVVVISVGLYFTFIPKSPVSPPKSITSDRYLTTIQPIFDARCVACHSCYNSPCQMDLTSHEGVKRGASKTNVYDFPLLNANPPTRIGIDAHSESGWREKGFYSVLGTDNELDSSILYQLIHAKKRSEKTQVKFDAEESRFCADGADDQTLNGYFEANPQGQMPYGLPSLDEKEFATVQQWLKEGAYGPTAEALQHMKAPFKSKAVKEIRRWENYLNERDGKSRLSARYIYEHLFLAHVYFDEWPGEYYRIIRATNRDGEPKEISTTRPYDDPGKTFFYRFKKYTFTIVAKTHMIYHLDDKRMSRWEELFNKTQWSQSAEKLPPYGAAKGANPFQTFKNIPVKSRYQFLLDDAYYHISTFIKGPVCRGQTALNVINDHFWVMFLDPDFDIAVTEPKFLNEAAHLMTPPASAEDDLKLFKNFRKGYWTALEKKYDFYKKSPEHVFNMKSIWDGEGSNNSALLTIYRHFNSAQVMKGAHGEIPRTVWVLDYQVLEDIYYNLVAGYDVFGPVIHQLNTRLYMEISRISGEDMFINFMPKEKRASIRQTWVRETPMKEGTISETLLSVIGEKTFRMKTKEYPYLGAALKHTYPFEEKDPKAEFLRAVFETHLNQKVKGPDDLLNRKDLKDTFSLSTIEKNLSPLTGITGDFIPLLPDVMFLRVQMADEKDDVMFSIVHNKEHFNVSMLLFEDERRDRNNDTLNILPFYAASYPNLYLKVKENKVEDMVKQLKNISTPKELDAFLKTYAISRHSRDFWDTHDWFNKKMIDLHNQEAGKLDLNRYMNF